MVLNVAELERQFESFSIDPSKVNKAELWASINLVNQTLDLSTPASIKIANAAIASISQAVYFKIATAKHWSILLENELESARASIAVVAHRDNPSFSKAEIDALVNSSQATVDLSKRYASAYGSFEFWSQIAQMLSRVADRVDSNGKTIAVESNLSSNIVRS